MKLEITIDHPSWKKIPGLRQLTKRAIHATLKQEEVADKVTISLLFADDQTIQQLNKEWRGKDKPTNILSFPANQTMLTPEGEQPSLGDMVLAYETIGAEAEAQKKPVADHVTHLLVHGTLHLLGYDHEDDQEAEIMEAREVAVLASLAIANPYGDHE